MPKRTPIPPILPIRLAIPAERVAAVARMHIELSLALHATIFPDEQEAPRANDANLTLVAVAVILGHAEGRPMTAAEIVATVQRPRNSVMRKLKELRARNVITVINDRYYLQPGRKTAPHRAKLDQILSKAFAAFGPHLSKMDI